jgi:hypothetical protein
VLTVNALGLHLLDYLQFTVLRQVRADPALVIPVGDRAAAAADRDRSPISPIAIL